MTNNEYEIVQTNREKYVNYKVYVRSNNEIWFVIRRYREFRALFDVLKKQYPDADLKIPPKKILGNFWQCTINERLEGLNKLVAQIFAVPGAINNEHCQEFFQINDPRNAPLSQTERPDGYEDEGNETMSDDYESNLGDSYRKKMSSKDFNFRKVIGKGSFGRVYLADHLETGNIYAVKVLAKSKLKSAKERHHLMSERNVLLNNLQHPFLVSLHFSFQTPTKLYFVLDYVNGGELFYHLQKERIFKEDRAKFYAAEIACALGYLHSRHIIYRDLKPENLLLDRHGHIVITDFGLAKEKMNQHGGVTQTFCGTPEYLAPEVLLKKPYTYALDWWCLGCVLYEMIFGVPPFYQKDHNAMYEAIKTKAPNFNRKNIKISENGMDILSRMLAKNPQERIGFNGDLQEFQSHPFFQSLNFEELEKKHIEPPYVPNVRSADDVSHIDNAFLNLPMESVPDGSLQAGVFSANDDNFAGFSYVRPIDD